MENAQNNTTGFILISIISLLSIIGMFFLEPIPQDLNYHLFVDTLNILNIPNFWNTMSNLPFLIVGTFALYKLLIIKKLNILEEHKTAYILLFSGTALVALGSGYYHLWPNNQTLVWDRLPMTIAFMSLFSIIISEFISLRTGKTLLFPLLLIGASSVLYWNYTESNGVGDLRFYALVQFLPMLLIPLILILFPSKYKAINGYWWLLGAYIAAKILEYFDTEIYDLLGVISGHSLKHVAAALGMYILLVHYERRSITSNTN